MTEHTSPEPAPLEAMLLGGAAEYAGLRPDADAERIAPLLASYTARIRALAPRDILAGGPAITFDPSWDDG